MKEKEFNYIHMIIAICITALLVYVFIPKNEIVEPEYQEHIEELYKKIEDLNENISFLQDKIENIERNTSEIIGYVDEIHGEMFPNSEQHSLIVKDN